MNRFAVAAAIAVTSVALSAQSPDLAAKIQKFGEGAKANAAALKASILAHQTSAEDAGRMAQAAGVKTLVLSHLVPADDPEVTARMWIDAAQTHFGGRVILGRDLLEI